MSDDDDRTPMTRTELAMLWDLLGRWMATHGGQGDTAPTFAAGTVRRAVDAELAERFGG